MQKRGFFFNTKKYYQIKQTFLNQRNGERKRVKRREN